MKRVVCLALCTAMLLCLGCQSIRESSGVSKFMPEINPYSKSGGSTQSVTLYFPVTGEAYLSSYTTNVEVRADSGDTLQDALMRELAKGPAQGLPLDPVFEDNLRKISMNVNGNLLTVILSKELLTAGEGTSSDSAQKRQIIVYSIVNTMTGNGDISQVQILVDTDGSGRGNVPTRQQVGLMDSGANEALGPLGFSNAYVLTPNAAAKIVLDSAKSKDAERMIRLLAGSVTVPNESNLKTELQNSKIQLIDYFIADVQTSSDNQSATAYVDITYAFSNGTEKQVFNQPVALKRDRGVWKVDYQSVEPLLFP